MFQYDLYPYPAIPYDKMDYIRAVKPSCVCDAITVKPANNDFLIVGCGWSEAVMAARCFPDKLFTGIDLSEKSIQISNELKNELALDNLSLINGDFDKHQFHKKYNSIIITGVLHHMENPRRTLNKITSLLSNIGIVSGMVYASNRRFLDKKVQYFRSMGWTDPSNREHIDAIKDHLGSLRIGDKCGDWFQFYNQADPEIVDTWMHYRYRTYSKGQLIKLFSQCGLKILATGIEGGKLLFVAEKK